MTSTIFGTYLPEGENKHLPIAVDENGFLYVKTIYGGEPDQPSPRIDSFSRQIVAQPYSLGDYIFKFDLLPDFFDANTTGTGSSITHLPNSSSALLTCGTEENSLAQLITRKFHRYQAGNGMEVEMTGVIGAPVSEYTKEWGYFDDNDGLLFRQDDEGNFYVVKRSSTTGSKVDTAILQENFNLDKLDGTGASGYNIDLTKSQIFFIDFQWLGTGGVMFGIVNEKRKIIPCHIFEHANQIETVYMKTAYLPIQYRVENSGVAGAGATLNAICSTVKVNGGQEPPEYPYEESSGLVSLGTTNETFIMAIRLSSTFKSIENRMLVFPKELTFNQGGESIRYKMYKGKIANVTSTGWQQSSNSGVEYTLSQSALSLSGLAKPIDKTYIGAKNDSKSAVTNPRSYGLSRSADNLESDTLIITAQRLTGQSTDVAISIGWGEIR